MGSFSYTPDASFSEKLTLLMPVLMWSLCYSLRASFAMNFIYIPDDDRFNEE